MRIAYCLHGLLGFTDSKGSDLKEKTVGQIVDPRIGYDSFCENLRQNHEVDIFAHSWSHQHKNLINKLYEPKEMVTEEQIDFSKHKNFEFLVQQNSLAKKIRLSLKKILDQESYKKIYEKNQNTAFRSFSRWYSAKESLSLCRNYAEMKSIEYDIVFLSRFDIEFFTAFDFNQYDTSYLWASHWNNYPTNKYANKADYTNQYTDTGLMDLWFFSKPENMFQIIELYKDVHRYPRSPHSAILQHLQMKRIPINYTKYRWHDYDLIRRHKMGSSA